jgi:hypothetical protein
MHCETRRRRRSPLTPPVARGRKSGPRIRTLKPEIHEDKAYGRCTYTARLLFVGLITQADDEGRLRGDLPLLRSRLYPWDDLALDVLQGWLDELAQCGLIVCYTVAGDAFIALSGWHNQKIDHPTPSKYPSPPVISPDLPAEPLFDVSRDSSRGNAEDSRTFALDQDREQGSGRDQEQPRASARADEAVLGLGYNEVLSIASQASEQVRDLLVQDTAISSTIRAYPTIDPVQAAHLAAADLTSGRRTTKHFHVAFADRMRDSVPAAAQADDSVAAKYDRAAGLR